MKVATNVKVSSERLLFVVFFGFVVAEKSRVSNDNDDYKRSETVRVKFQEETIEKSKFRACNLLKFYILAP